MNKDDEKIVDEHLTPEFKKLAENYLYKLNQIMDLTNDAEAIYILNITLKVLNKRFGDQ